MSLTKDGFYKQIGGVTGDNSYVLLAGGGHQKFGNESSYIPISNGTKNVNLNADLLDGYHSSSFSFTSHTHSVSINGSTKTIAASGGTSVNLGTYHPWFKDSSLNANSADVGWHDVANSITNAAHSNHSSLIYVNNVGTPYQLQIPDSSVLYIYKRWYSGGSWSAWNKISAGYADSAGSVAWGNVTGKPDTFTPSSHNHDDRYYTESESDNRFLNVSGDTMNSGGQIVVGSISNSSGAVYNGGIQLRERTYSTTNLSGTVYTDGPAITFHWGGKWAHILNMHSDDLFWDNNKIWHEGNDGSGTGLDADKVDGLHADSFKNRIVAGTTGRQPGWYRLLDCTQYSMAFLITFYGGYNWCPPTPVTFLVNHSYTDTTITQIGKTAYIGWITKLRAIHHDTYKFYIDVYFNNTSYASNNNASNGINFEVTPLDPNARSYISVQSFNIITDSLTSNAECSTGKFSAEALFDSNNGTPITASYASGGFSSNPSWITAWNGYHLTYVSPSVLNVNYAANVAVNDSNSNSTYRIVWHSGNTLYSTNNIYCNPSSDTIYNNGTFANVSGQQTAGGVSLYGSDYTYGIIFRTTSSLGTHGGVTSDWATYLTMSDTTNRGWIFRRGSTNVASIDGNGRIYVGTATSTAEPGLYWNPYVESSTDGSDVSKIYQIRSGVAGGTELRISQANDSNDVINICSPYYIYLNSKRAFGIYDGWLRINENLGFSSGIYTGSSLVRSDNQLQVGSSGSAFYANSSGNGYFSNTLGIGTTRPSYKLHVIGDIYANGGWLRSSGATGWYNESYGGGMWMNDSTYVRVYNGKYLYTTYQYYDVGNQDYTIDHVYASNDRFIRPMAFSTFTTKLLSQFGITTDTRRSKNSSNANIESVTGYVMKNKSFIDIWGFAPTATYRTTKDSPAPYGIGFTDGSDSGGIMPVGDSNALKEIRFYGANSGPTHFTFGRMNWESTSYDSDNSNSFSIYTDIDGTNGNMWTSGSVAIGTSSFADKLRVNGGIIRVDANGVYLRIGPQNSSHCHYETNAGTSHWFNKRVDVNGDIYLYGKSTRIQMSNEYVYARGFYHLSYGSAYWVNRTDGGAACFNYGSKNSANCSYVWGWAADNDYRLYATGSLSVNYANYSNWAHYLAPHYDGGDKPNPQQYFNYSIGVKVAMTRNTSLGGTSMWADTLWINGYTGSDVPNMCALTFARNASPRFFISTQSNRATSYGTYYEVASAYNTYVTNGYGYILGNYITKLYPVASNPDNSHPGYGCRVFYSWNTGQAGNGSSGYSNGITIGSHPNDQAYGFQIVQNMWDDKLYFRRYNGGWQSWRTCYDNVYHPYADYSSTVAVNNSDANSTYRMVWHSGNTLYSTGGIYCNPSSDYLYASSFYCGNWFRSSGQSGWYNESYGGGIWMTDSSWVRTYNSKGMLATCFYASNWASATYLLRSDGGAAAFNWSGQSGQPTWIWGGNSQHNYYVYNPSNFSVNYANYAGYLTNRYSDCTHTGANQFYIWYDWNNTGNLGTYFHGLWCGAPDGNIGFQIAYLHQEKNWLHMRTWDYGSWNAWVTILTSSNYTSYTDSRYLRKDTNDSTPYQYTFSKTNDHAIQIGTIRGYGVGSCTGNYLHIYERVHIGSPSGWGSRNAPSYGLSTYGGAWLATDTGSVGIGCTDPGFKLDVRGTGRFTGRLYPNEWVEFSGYQGLYWPGANEAAHIYPNSTTSYGAFIIRGARNGYAGIQLGRNGTNTGYMTIMDNQDDKGLYEEDWGWILYFNRRNKKLSFRTSSDLGADNNFNGSLTAWNYRIYGSAQAFNCNDVTCTGLWYYSSKGPSTQLGARSTDGALYSQAYSTSWVGQIAQDYRDGGLYVRGKNNNSWQKWLQVMLVDLTSSAVTNCNSVYRTGIYTHSGFSNRPSGVDNWGTLLNYKLYEDNNSYHRQIFLDCYGTNRIWTRANNGGTWTDWVELVRNTGTWAISITGNADTVDNQHFTYSNSSNSPTYLWGTNSSGTNFLARRDSLSVSYANSAGNADKLDGYHASGLFTSFGNSGNNITATIGGTTKTFTVNYASNADKLDGYHEYNFMHVYGFVSGQNFNIADSARTSGIYYRNKDSGSNANAPTDYGLLVDFNSNAGHLQLYSTTTKNDLKLRTYWWTNGSGFTYPSWVTVLTSANWSSYISTSPTISKTTTLSGTTYVAGTSSNQTNFTTCYYVTQFYFTSSGAFHTSDVRKKYDIRDILNDDVNRLFETENGFIRHYKWKSTNKDAYGFIAQELQEYCPEAVDFNNDDGYYAVNYNVAFSKIIGAMFKKIKELERKLKENGIP